MHNKQNHPRTECAVLDTIIEQAETVPVTAAVILRAMRAYSCLTKNGAPMGKGELDMCAEQYLRDKFNIEIDFEIQDALDKLERLGIVERSGESYSALPVQAALAKLDAAWDRYFNFTA